MISRREKEMSSNKGGFWRKVAGAFVEIDEPAAPPSTADLPPNDAEETAALLAQLGGAPPTPPQAPPAAPPLPVTDIIENRPFSDIYAQAGVPTVHQTAEQLLTILDGLAAMPKEACRLAVKKMDEADDRWTIADVQLDAENKRRALQSAVDGLKARVATEEHSAIAERENADKLLTEAESAIQAQIAQLTQELTEFRAAAAEKKAAADAQLANVREVAHRESARIESELFRLSRITAFFETTPFNAPPPLPPRS